MKHKCGNCGHFESRGLMSGSTNWGICSKFSKGVADNNIKSPFFRWEDDTCSNFEARQEYIAMQQQKDETPIAGLSPGKKGSVTDSVTPAKKGSS